MSEQQQQEQTEPDDDENVMGCTNCGEVPESDMEVVFDQNFDYPWKSGNPYSRVCPECGARTFTAKSHWQTKRPHYIILKGEDEMRLHHPCPVDGCNGHLVDKPDSCDECGVDIGWEDNTPKPVFSCPYDGCDGELIGMAEQCPECEKEIEWE